MRARPDTKKILRRAVVAAAIAAASVLAATVAGAQAPATTFDLCAKAGTIDLPGHPGITIWGFASKPAGVSCSDSSVVSTLPGPELIAPPGVQVTITVTNTLGRTIALEIPGLSVDQGPAQIADNASGSYTFTPGRGTYLYRSAGDEGRQAAMGLHGALVVRPPEPDPPARAHAYDDPTSDPDRSAYDSDATLVLSEIDPNLNADPLGFNLLDWAPTYWLINGKAYPDTGEITGAPGSRVLLRWVSAGPETVTMTMANGRATQLAQDAELLANPFSVVSDTLPAGSTADALVTIPPAGERIVLYNRQMHLVNGTGDPALGGMLTSIHG
jgi:FtsP/CotA-like multicopper oxidase with cupredoxin domain